MKKLLTLAVSAVLSIAALQANEPVKQSNYDLPAQFSNERMKTLIHSTAVTPKWIGTGQQFWYSYTTSAGTKYWLVTPAKRERKPLFDEAKMAADLTRITGDPYDAQHLPTMNMKFSEDGKTFKFNLQTKVKLYEKDSTGKVTSKKKEFHFEFDIAAQRLSEVEKSKDTIADKTWANVSPDGETILFARNYNLYMMDKENYEKAKKNENDTTIVEHQLTTDGVRYFAFGGGYEPQEEFDEKKIKKELETRRSVMGLWSPDSKNFVMVVADQRKVKSFWVIHSLAKPRPTLESYKYMMPGEKGIPYHLYMFNVDKKSRTEVDMSRFKDQTLEVARKPRLQLDANKKGPKRSIWLGTEDKFYVTVTSRDLKRIDICEVDVASAKPRTLIEERMNTYVEVRPIKPIKNFTQFVHWSERDGWAHLYLYNNNGEVVRQLTSGEFHVEKILGVDETANVVYFTANGREKNENPYYLHLYKVSLDGGAVTLLTPGDADHLISTDDDCRWFVDNHSRVDRAPGSALYDRAGNKLMDLETADMSQLLAAGYKFPETFKVKAADGITDLYGVMYKPYNFDSTKLYPIIEYVYPGPQTEAVDSRFNFSHRTDRLAQFGFIVITIGNRGGHPSRSKWYHNYGYGNLRDYGLEDKVEAVRQLAARHNFIDINKVGIHGHSGGGFMSTAAILSYPNFFKVAVSCAGNHENSIYNRWWSEKHHGVEEVVSAKGDTTFKYSITGNSELAPRLKGHLMLVTGDVDNNVNPANTVRVVDALIKAGKRFEYVVLPGQRHGFGSMTEYFFWKMGDYFCRHLIGDSQDTQPDIVQMQK
ncbi:MAG: DPP IV N-terminal domain-containing protein [Rikenellaceae bacterium]|nr:DPP IV N-terminal domain-containing protein [Rikenellaceae bacterium]